MNAEIPIDLAAVASLALLAEGRCALGITRSSQGRVKIEFRTHALGKIDIELATGSLEDLLFGRADVQADITRVIPNRKPNSYPANTD